MNFIKKYSFHIFSVLLFISISIYKFFPTLFVSELPKEDSPVLSTDIYVDLSGAVKNPGVYMLPSESRVGDLLNMAKGFSENASAIWISKNFNLAKLLSDSQKIYIPYEWEIYEQCNCMTDELTLKLPDIPLGTTTSNIETNEINVNTATGEELESLSGIGPSYSQKIIDNRPYTGVEDFIERSQISENTINKILDAITF